MEPRVCEQCGVLFTASYRVARSYWRRRRFCGPECYATARVGSGTPRLGQRRSLEARFWPKVDRRAEDDCWEWTGGRDADGYGYLGKGIDVGRGTVRAHRAAWELAHGPIPAGLVVCHRCDNPPCCNVAHLFVGTSGDNNRDRSGKGRDGVLRGSDSPTARLAESDVREIVRLVEEDGVTQMRVAEMYGIKQPQVSRIVRRTSWAHLWSE